MATPILVAHTGAGAPAPGNVTTSAIDTTGADFICAVIADFTANTPTITDSKGNTWFFIGFSSPATSQKCLMYICYPTSVGTGHTFSTVAGGVASLAIQAWSGVVKGTGTQSFSTNTFTVQPGTVAFGQNGSLIITGICVNAILALTIDDGFTISDQVPVVGGAHEGVGMAYLITNTGSHSPTWTLSVSTSAAGLIAAFASAGSAGGGGGSFVF